MIQSILWAIAFTAGATLLIIIIHYVWKYMAKWYKTVTFPLKQSEVEELESKIEVMTDKNHEITEVLRRSLGYSSKKVREEELTTLDLAEEVVDRLANLEYDAKDNR